MEIPGLGLVSFDVEDDALVSEPLPFAAFGGVACPLVVIGYDDDADARHDYHAAIGAFLALGEATLKAASTAVFAYYQDVKAEFGDAADLVAIAEPDGVWEHVRPGEATVQRNDGDDREVYVSVECECAWEPEHGLQIVLRSGQSVTKVGPFDGHLTNASAFGRDDLVGVVYHRGD